MDRDSVITTIAKGALTVTVDSFGAQVTSIKREGIEYLWQGDGTWWKGQSPVLFPIVGRLRDDYCETSRGPAPMKRHGVARISPFAIDEAVEDKVQLTLVSNDDTRALYPFDFKLTMTYTVLDGERLEQRFRVENTGDVDLPFVLGGHPAFNVPLNPATGEVFEDYELRFAKPWSASSPILVATGLWNWQSMMEVVRESDTVPLTRHLFDSDTLCFTDVPDSIVSLVGTKSGLGVEVSFDGFPYLGVWSYERKAPFVALEPWTGCATSTDEDESLEGKRGMTFLAPGDVFERAFTIRPF